MDPITLVLIKRIPLLTQNNWFQWKWKMQLILEQLGLWFFLNNSELIEQNSNDPDFITLDQKIQTILVLTMHDEMIPIIIHHHKQPISSRHIWNCLVEYFNRYIDNNHLSDNCSKSNNLMITKDIKICEKNINEKISKLSHSSQSTINPIHLRVKDTFDVVDSSALSQEFESQFIHEADQIINSQQSVDSAAEFNDNSKLTEQNLMLSSTDMITITKENGHPSIDENEEKKQKNMYNNQEEQIGSFRWDHFDSDVNKQNHAGAQPSNQPIEFDLGKWYIMLSFSKKHDLSNVSKFYVFSERYLALLWLKQDKTKESVWLSDFRSKWFSKLSEFDSEKIVSIAMGFHHIVILTDRNRAYRLDGCYCKQLGSYYLSKIKPILMRDNIKKIASGKEHILLLDNQGQVWASGCNGMQQIQLTDQYRYVNLTKINSNNGMVVEDIACTAEGSLLLTKNGYQVYFQGALKSYNSNSQQWIKTIDLVESEVKIKSILGGYSCFMIITTDGQVSLYQIAKDGRKKLTSLMSGLKDEIEQGYATCLDDIFVLVTYMNERGHRQIYIYDPRHSLHMSQKYCSKSYVSEAYNLYSLYPITPMITDAPDLWTKPPNAFNVPNEKDLTFRIFQNYGFFRNIYAQKSILAKHSKYFYTFIKDIKKNLIDINGYSYAAFYSYLLFIYVGHLDSDPFHKKELSKIANEYQDDKLRKAIEKL